MAADAEELPGEAGLRFRGKSPLEVIYPNEEDDERIGKDGERLGWAISASSLGKGSEKDIKE
ncbi:hypothetical protein M1N01_00715 [Thermodesulfovibrionales bacterium]|nr:hypothetical protein [Thermodesulfovibrionales bacterium]